MQFNKNNKIIRLLVFFTALQILNLSIDSPASQISNYSTGHDQYNYIDSYIEFVAEIILKYENAIPESQTRQQKELQQHKQFEVICEIAVPLVIKSFYQLTAITFIADSDKYIYRFVKEIKPPPEFS